MKRLVKTTFLIALGLVGAGALYSVILALTADIPVEVPSAPGPGEWVGVLHVHTVASDGGGTVAQVAGAARELGLDFVVVTDHNVWAAERWAYHEGPLLILGEEVNTPYGHLLVVGGGRIGNREEPEQLPTSRGPHEGADTGDVAGGGPVSDAGTVAATLPVAVAPEEGLRIAAHPLGKRSWKTFEEGHFDGIEIWNADTERRGDPLSDWIPAVALLPLNPVAGLFRLLDHPSENLALWDRLLAERRVYGVCSPDAHHRMPVGPIDIPLPSYRQSFSLARQHVLLDGTPTGDADADGRLVLDALRRGRSYCAWDGMADARGLTFRIVSGDLVGGPGQEVEWRPGAEVEVLLPPAGEERSAVRVIRDGEVLAQGRGRLLRARLPGPGTYRLEASLRLDDHRWLPWILSNPIWVVGQEPEPAP